MKINDDARTHLGQKAQIIHVSTTSAGRKLFALKTCATRPVATAWDDATPLLAYAVANRLNLQA